jgi:sugar lactone lactonase YvrE
VVTTVAGSTRGVADGTGAAAQFNSPRGAAVDRSGNIYVADMANHRIRKITPDGVVTTVAGSTRGAADGMGAAAQFNQPSDVAVDRSGNVYVADWGNHRIRKITPAGVVTTLAGSTQGDATGSGSAAKFSYPSSVAVDGSGNVYVADWGNSCIRKITPAGMVTSIAYRVGPIIGLNSPIGIAVDGSGNIYVAERGAYRIQKITPAGVMTTLAGSGTAGDANGSGTAAQFKDLRGIAVDGAGAVYVVEEAGEHIRKISPTGLVTSVVANRWDSARNAGTAALFDKPQGIAVDGAGTIYVTEEGSNAVRKAMPPGTLTPK